MLALDTLWTRAGLMRADVPRRDDPVLSGVHLGITVTDPWSGPARSRLTTQVIMPARRHGRRLVLSDRVCVPSGTRYMLVGSAVVHRDTFSSCFCPAAVK
ncbi:hypothetical protein GCM10027282_07350 [Frigoribacterium salinisoli]